MKECFDLSGKTILVTGASSGIGRQEAICLSECGAKVIMVARREKELLETMERMQGTEHAYYCVDLNELDEIGKVMKEITGEHGKLHGMAYCAGVASLRPYHVADPKSVIDVMKINFFAYYEMTRQFVKKSNSVEGAKIVVVSSLASKRPGKGQGAYAASKGAIESANLVLAQELIPRHINVNSVCPGRVETPMTANLSEEDKEHALSRQPLGIISPSDISYLITYLLSPAADMITGRSFDIDGGGLSNE